jgi:DNA (cytosine-5)-methyltransferase 1
MIPTLDLFCGGGGSSWGATSGGADIVGAIDGWDIATATFADNFPRAFVRNSKLRPRSGRSLFARIADVQLLLASPECTNHTCARGALSFDETSRETALYVLNYIRAFQPRWVVIENVVQMRSWARYHELLDVLGQYYKIKAQVLDASDFGVPQTRRRLFILCDRTEEPPDLATHRSSLQPTARNILDPPGTWEAMPLYRKGRASETLARAKRAMGNLGEGVPFLIVYYSMDGGGGWQSIDRPLRTLTTLDRFGLVEWDRGEPTLRMLQVPELKRAMGFDNSYRMMRGTRRDRIKLLGNGVCPPVMQHIIARLTSCVQPLPRHPKPELASPSATRNLPVSEFV